MRILALTRYERLGSSSRVRFYQYFPYLKAQGAELVNAPFFTDVYVQNIYTGKTIPKWSVFQAYTRRFLSLLSSSKYDVLWVEKELFPWLPAWFEKLLRTLGIPYVVDYDDAVFHRYDMHTSAIVRTVLGHKIDQVMHHAALTIVGNEYLADRAKHAGAKRIEYLPSVVNVSSYTLKKNIPKSTIRIGWIGSPVTAPYLDGIRDALSLLSKEADIQITLIGSGNTVQFPGILTTVIPWDEQVERSIGEIFDVGIMPLVDGPFERGKCGYKLVQYMAGGLPVVASPVGINKQIIDSGINGYLATSTDDWVQALRTLIGNDRMRFEMGKAGRQKAEQMYNLQVTAPKLLNLLSSAQKAKD